MSRSCGMSWRAAGVAALLAAEPPPPLTQPRSAPVIAMTTPIGASTHSPVAPPSASQMRRPRRLLAGNARHLPAATSSDEGEDDRVAHVLVHDDRERSRLPCGDASHP